MEAEIEARLYDDVFEGESVAPPAPVPEVSQPEPQVAVLAEPNAIQLMQQMAATFAEACRGRPTEPTCSVAMREFMRMTPPLFYGNPDPLIAESWLDATIKALDAIQVSDDATRVVLATYQMRDAADLWWKSVRNTKNVVCHAPNLVIRRMRGLGKLIQFSY